MCPSLVNKLLICISLLFSAAVAKPGGTTVRSEVKISVDAAGAPHTIEAINPDEQLEDVGEASAMQVEVNDHGDVVNPHRVAKVSARKPHTAGARAPPHEKAAHNATEMPQTSPSQADRPTSAADAMLDRNTRAILQLVAMADQSSSALKNNKEPRTAASDSVMDRNTRAIRELVAMADQSSSESSARKADQSSSELSARKESSVTTEQQIDDIDEALDELEAMTLRNAMSRKHSSPPKPVDCEWAEWHDAGTCSTTCGAGIKTRKREERVKEQHNGKKCQGDKSKVVECNSDVECPTTTTTMSFTMPMQNGATGILDKASWLALVGCLTLKLIIPLE